MSIENSQSYITNELVPDRMRETARKKLKPSSTSKKVKQNKGNSQWHSLDGSHMLNFNNVMYEIHFYYREMVRARSSTPYFFPKCHLQHRGEKFFAIFFFDSNTCSTISLLWNICILSVLGHNLSLGKLKPCIPNQKQRKSKSKSK